MNLKQKNIALALGVVLFLWLSYQFSFSKTLEARKQYNELLQDQLLFSDISNKLTSLQTQKVYYDSILRSKRISSENSFQNNLLSTINAFADSTNIAIISFQDPHIYKADGNETHTYAFNIKGGFHNITKLVYALEQESKLGKIVSVNYTKKKNYRRNSEYLECAVLLQQIVQE